MVWVVTLTILQGICGYNTGQHMYIGASDLCNRIIIDMDQDLQYTRLWDIKAEFTILKAYYSSSIQILPLTQITK